MLLSPTPRSLPEHPIQAGECRQRSLEAFAAVRLLEVFDRLIEVNGARARDALATRMHLSAACISAL